MSRKIVGYLRVSTARQGTSGLGLEAQEAAILAYSRTTAGTILASYTEVESGRKCDRPQLALALAHAKRAKATLVIAKLDRLARNVAFIANLIESGVQFIAADNPHANTMTIHMLAVFAEDEARRISERTRAALAAYKARGGTLGMPGNATPEGRALGSQRAGERVARNADHAYADLIPQVQAMRADGLTLKAIADRLTADGQTTRRGLPWNQMQVSRVLGRAAK